MSLKLVVKKVLRYYFVRPKIYERKVKSPSIIYADFESIVLPEDEARRK